MRKFLKGCIRFVPGFSKLLLVFYKALKKLDNFIGQELAPPWGIASERDLRDLDANIPISKIAGHTTWGPTLQPILNHKGIRVLEIGSRAVNTQGVFKNAFALAEYVGFDFHAGENVDVVGDAHRLSSYFDQKFDAVVSSAVFEHLVFPWVVAEEISKVLKPGGLVFIQTHFSYSMHEMPWHFFQFSHKALEAMFNSDLGFETIESGVNNPIIGRFSIAADEYLIGKPIVNLYCHSSYLGKKVISGKLESSFDWRSSLKNVYENTEYPRNTSKF